MVWLKKEDSIVHIKYYDASTKTISGVAFYVFDKEFELIKRIDAKKGSYRGEHWLFENVHQPNTWRALPR